MSGITRPKTPVPKLQQQKDQTARGRKQRARPRARNPHNTPAVSLLTSNSERRSYGEAVKALLIKETQHFLFLRDRGRETGVWTQPQCRAPDIRGAPTAHGTGEMHLYSRFPNDMITVKNQANKNQNNQYMNPELPHSSSMRDAVADHHYPGKCSFPYSYISTGLPNRFIK